MGHIANGPATHSTSSRSSSRLFEMELVGQQFVRFVIFLSCSSEELVDGHWFIWLIEEDQLDLWIGIELLLVMVRILFQFLVLIVIGLVGVMVTVIITVIWRRWCLIGVIVDGRIVVGVPFLILILQ